MELPQESINKLRKLAEGSDGGITYEELEKEYIEFFNDKFVQEDESFIDDASRHDYTLMRTLAQFKKRPPVSPHSVIPIGVDSVRKDQTTGIKRTSLFVLDSKSGKNRRLSLQGDICDVVKDISFNCLYENVMLSKFRDSNDLSADDRAVFKNPISIDTKAEDLVESLGLKTVNIKEAQDDENHSRVDAKGWPIKTDWYAIRGIIRSIRRSKEDAESEWGSYKIFDRTVDPTAEPTIDAKGNKHYPGMSLWIAPMLMQYPVYSDCIFLGTIGKNPKTNEVSMNCYSVLPIHVEHEEE